MIEINLLPWRIEQRVLKKRNNKLSVIVGMLFGLGILVILHSFLTIYLNQLNKKSGLFVATVAMMKASTDQASKLKEQYEASLKKFNLLQRLERKQSKAHEELGVLISIAALPIIINEIRQIKNLITFKGETDSIEKLQQFVIQLNKKHYFSQIQLKEINQLPRAKNFYFVLIANVREVLPDAD